MEEVFRAQFFFAHSQFVTVGKKLANHAAVFFQPVGPRVLPEYFLFFVKVPVVPNSGSNSGSGTPFCYFDEGDEGVKRRGKS